MKGREKKRSSFSFSHKKTLFLHSLSPFHSVSCLVLCLYLGLVGVPRFWHLLRRKTIWSTTFPKVPTAVLKVHTLSTSAEPRAHTARLWLSCPDSSLNRCKQQSKLLQSRSRTWLKRLVIQKTFVLFFSNKNKVPKRLFPIASQNAER